MTIFTQYASVVKIVGKQGEQSGPSLYPNLPDMVEIEFRDGRRDWRSPWELRADGGMDEINAAAANAPERDSCNPN